MDQEAKLAVIVGSVVVTTLIGSLAIAAVPGQWTAIGLKLPDLISAASAAGTIFAAFVALRLGLQSQKQLQQAQLDRAVVGAARHLPRLREAVTAMHRALVVSEFVEATDEGFLKELRQVLGMRQAIQRCLALEVLNMETATIEKLIGLPNRTAARISTACGLIDQVRTIPRLATTGLANVFADEAIIRKSLEQLLEAARHLEIALRECEKQARLHAPSPTGEDLYPHED